MRNSRQPWLWLIIIINIIGAAIIYERGELVGDLSGSSLHSVNALYLATILVVFSYYMILGPVFDLLTKVKIKTIHFHIDEAVIVKRLGIFVAVWQIAYLAFCLTYGLNIAGAVGNKSSTPFSILFVLIPPDLIFIIYYGLYRESKYFGVNLLIWIFSNMMRGWSGVFLAIAFFEWCRISKKNEIVHLWRNIFFAFTTLIAISPIIANFKWLIRASSADGVDFQSVFFGVFDNIRAADYVELLQIELTHMITRIQTVSVVVEVVRLSDLLQAKYQSGAFAPFWKEGLHGVIYDRLLGQEQLTIGVAFTQYMDTTNISNLGDWNVSLGYPGWFFITPTLIPIYILYTFFLGIASYFLMKKISTTQLSLDVLWYAWFAYLLAPWFGVFTGFIYALIVFIFIKMLAAKIPPMRFF